MKRLLAFALIAAFGMFVIGCGGGHTEPPAKPSGQGFHSGTGNTPPAQTPAKKP
jgi:hypothetical protein